MDYRRKKYLVVGAGITGCAVARRIAERGHIVHIIDKRSHVGGLCADKIVNDVRYHTYGPHIFHTNSVPVYTFVSKFTKIREWKNRVLALTDKGLLNIPINLQSISTVFNIAPDVKQALSAIEHDKIILSDNDEENAETFLYAKIGKTLTDTFFRGYSERQWKMPLNKIPASIVKRIPLPRMNMNDSYFDDTYQGLPDNGYNTMFMNMLNHPNIFLDLGVEYDSKMMNDYEHIWFTGPIDEFFNFNYGALPYNSVKWKISELGFVSELGQENTQGNAVINNCKVNDGSEYTRSIEYALFENRLKLPRNNFITHEIPMGPHFFSENVDCTLAYPIRTPENIEKYEKYKAEAEKISDKVTFIGRLAEYQYYNMDKAIDNVMHSSSLFIFTK